MGKYVYSNCGRCGCAKKTDTNYYCRHCAKKRLNGELPKKERNQKYNYNSNGNPLHKNCVVCGADKKENTTTFCPPCRRIKHPTITERKWKVNSPEEKELIRIQNELIEEKNKYKQEIIDFILSIINRNHCCSYVECFMIVNYHDILFPDKTAKDIYGCYRDLVKWLVKKKPGFRKEYISNGTKEK